MVMELSKEGNLFGKMRIERTFSESKSSRYMRSIIKAIDFMHRQNPPIIHRDLKPENLLLFDDDIVKLTDFGWSAQNDEIRNTFCGTQEYLAPEMIRGKGHDEKLDIWTLGVLLYEMIHGKTPFFAPKMRGDIRVQREKIEKKILSGTFTLKEDLNESTKEIIIAMLNPDPKKRPSSEELLNNFEFLSTSNEKNTRSKSVNIMQKENKVSKSDYEKLKLELAKLKQENELYKNENISLKNRIENSQNSTLILEMEMVKKKNERYELEIQILQQQIFNLQNDLKNALRDCQKNENNLKLCRDTTNKLETDLKQVKDLNVYLFQQTKVSSLMSYK